jgi:hypothetical protein
MGTTIENEIQPESQGGRTLRFWKPGKDQVWQELGAEIGAEFRPRQFFSGSRLTVHTGPWRITLDSVQNDKTQFTRIRAPYVSSSGLRFSIYRSSVFSRLGALLGMQDLEVGDSAFDEAFVVKSNDENAIRSLLDSPRVRSLLQEQPRLWLEARDNEGWFGTRFPDDVDVLRFRVSGIIKDKARLRGLFDLFTTVLNRLCEIGVATRTSTGIEL